MTIRFFIIFAVCILISGVSIAKTDIEPYQGVFDRSNILVKVEYFSHWHRTTVAAMDCNGKIKVVGVFSDTTSVSVFVNPETAVSMIDGLLAIDFFGLQDTFRSIKGSLKPEGPGKVTVGATSVIDGGMTRVTVYIGRKSHTVSLQNTAFGAPPELNSFVLEFKALVRNEVDKLR